EEIEQMWSGWTQNYSTRDGTPLTLMQTRHPRCIDMLARGIDADSFCIIGGIKPKELKAYQTRLNEKLAIDKAIALDS
ncbi:MAG: TetR/AcrR family transcriptional regulator, partial [Pseudanabaena sp.]